MANLLSKFNNSMDTSGWMNFFIRRAFSGSPVADWNVALNALRYKNHQWKYFKLATPPENQDDRMFYEDVQYTIQNLADFYSSIWGSRDDTKMIESLKRHIKADYEEAIEKEKQIFNIITDKPEWAKDYNTLIEKIEILNKQKTYISNQDAIDFWTRVFYGRLSGNNVPISDQDAFCLIMQSVEFYNFVKSKGSQDIFTRRGALKYKYKNNQKELDRAIKKVDEHIHKESLIILYDSFNDYVQNNIIPIDQDAGDKLLEAMDDVMGNYFERKKRGKGIAKTKFKGKEQLASSVSSTIRDKIEKTLEKIKEDQKNKTYKIDYSISLGDPENIFFQVSLDKDMNSFYGEKLATGQDLNSYDFVQNFFNNFKTILLNFKSQNGNLQAINLKSFGEILIKNLQDDNKLVKNNDRFLNFDRLVEKAYKFLNSGKVYNFFKKSYQYKDYWKSFNVANNNAFLTGLFGELNTQFIFSNVFKNKVQFTGSAFSVFGNSKGQSANDLRVQGSAFNDKKGTFGINVKNYIYSGNTFQLYTNENSYSIDNKALDKYLGSDDRLIIQFAFENLGYFKLEQVEKMATQISLYHIPEFIRVFDHTSGKMIKNIFFNINNIIYPLSYIYKCVLNEIESSNKTIAPSIFIDISLEGKEEPFTYPDLDTARKEWKRENFMLRSLKGTSNGELLIKPKGLKVNLASLSIFN